MSGSLTSRQVLALKIEDTPGTLDTGVYSTTYAKHQLAGDASMTFDFPRYVRDIKRSTLTPIAGLSGRQDASLSFRLELIGHASSSIPTWDAPIRSCGMRRETLSKVTIGAITGGPFRHGETVTQTTGGATAKVFLDTYTGTATLYLYDIRGTTTSTGGHTWVGGTSSASAQPSSTASAAGYGYAPVDFDTTLVTVTGTSGTIALGETVTGGTSGAKGIVEVVRSHTLTVTSVSGTIAVGDVATGGSSGAVAVVDEIVSSTVSRVRIRGATLFSGSESITFAGSGASATHSSTIQGQFAVRVRNALQFSVAETLTFGSAATATVSAVVQEDMPTLSAALYEDGKRKSAKGMRGTFTVDGRVGEPAVLNFNFSGSFGAIADAVDLTGIVYENRAVPPLLLGANTELRTEGTAGSYAARFSAISLALNNTLSPREDASVATGVREVMITARAGTGSVDPETDLEASYPSIGNFKDNKAGSLKFTLGSTVGNQFLVQVPGFSIASNATGDRSGIRTDNLSFEMTGGAMANVSDSPNERNDLLIAYITA